jgi:hypothetical protein
MLVIYSTQSERNNEQVRWSIRTQRRSGTNSEHLEPLSIEGTLAAMLRGDSGCHPVTRADARCTVLHKGCRTNTSKELRNVPSPGRSRTLLDADL